VIEGVLGVGAIIVFARLVSPRDFGAVALLVVIASVVTTVLSSPIGTAIVVQRLSDQRALSTAWWMALLPAAGIAVIWAAVAAVARPSSFVLPAVALSALLPLWAANSVLISIQQQRLDFRKLAIVRMTAVIGGTTIALVVAVLVQGLVGLIVRQLTIPFLQWTAGSAAARWAPSWAFDATVAGSIRRYAQGLVGFNVLNQVLRRGDDILVGGLLGPAALGYYSLAYRVIELPMAQIGQMSQNVSLPALTLIDEPARFRDAFLRIQKVLVWLVAPLGICAMFLGDVAVTTMLGARWEPAGPIVQVFGAIAIIQASDTQVGLILLARGATGKLFRWGLYWAPPFLACILVGLIWGPLGVAWSYLAFNAALFYPGWLIAGRLVDLTPTMVLRSLGLQFALAAAITAVGGAFRMLLDLESIGAIAMAGMLAACAYWGGALALDAGLRDDVVRVLRRSGSPAPAPS
jgi:PST family polysaccharide transporter